MFGFSRGYRMAFDLYFSYTVVVSSRDSGPFQDRPPLTGGGNRLAPVLVRE